MPAKKRPKEIDGREQSERERGVRLKPSPNNVMFIAHTSIYQPIDLSKKTSIRIMSTIQRGGENIKSSQFVILRSSRMLQVLP